MNVLILMTHKNVLWRIIKRVRTFCIFVLFRKSSFAEKALLLYSHLVVYFKTHDADSVDDFVPTDQVDETADNFLEAEGKLCDGGGGYVSTDEEESIEMQIGNSSLSLYLYIITL
jgi:hypothetical protein